MAQRLSTNPNSKDEVNFTVHNYAYNELLQPDVLRDAAFGLISAAMSLSDWSDVGVVSLAKYEQTSTSYVEFKPISISTPTKLAENAIMTLPLKNWGSPVDQDDDVFSLIGLEEFESTDFSSLLTSELKPQATIDTTPSLAFAGSTSTFQNTQDQHLYHVIPQPHIHPSGPTAARGPSKLIPYRKTAPIPIAPCMGTIPSLPYARCAWLIPVRGSFPWDQCTPATILEPSFIVPSSPNETSPVTWTYKSLQSLWEFLLDIKRRGTAGTIGISFHVSRGKSIGSQSLVNATFSVAPAGTVESSTTVPQDTTRFAHRIRLQGVDHIKIYHEAPYAMHLRNILHLWSYVVPVDDHTSSSRKIRVLRGARLALVDEGSRGILLA